MNNRANHTPSPITVTSPLLPKLEDFTELLQDIWQRKWLTNNGLFHKLLGEALPNYLGVPYISLFTNGTLPLIMALQALGLKHGEVIPYSFMTTPPPCPHLERIPLRKAPQHCATADRQLVSSQLDDRDILHKLIIALTA